jgi:hypothetical protein
MGLDNFAARHEFNSEKALRAHDAGAEDWYDGIDPVTGTSSYGLTAEDIEAFRVVGGSCFRGKLYDEHSKEITGRTLYEDLPAGTVAYMATRFASDKRSDKTLAAWFKVAAARGCDVLASY